MWLAAGAIVLARSVDVNSAVDVIAPVYGMLVLGIIVFQSTMVLQSAEKPRPRAAGAARREVQGSISSATAAADAAAAARPTKFADFHGTWELARSDNYENFLTFQGVPWAARKAVLSTKLLQEIEIDEPRSTVRMISKGLITTDFTLTLDMPEAPTKMRGNDYMDTATFDEGKLVIRKRKLLDGLRIINTRAMEGDGTMRMHVHSIKADGTECAQTQWYRKVL